MTSICRIQTHVVNPQVRYLRQILLFNGLNFSSPESKIQIIFSVVHRYILSGCRHVCLYVCPFVFLKKTTAQKAPKKSLKVQKRNTGKENCKKNLLLKNYGGKFVLSICKQNMSYESSSLNQTFCIVITDGIYYSPDQQYKNYKNNFPLN